MASFSQRLGLTEVRSAFQTEDLDEDTRVALWNVTSVLRTILARAESEHFQDDHRAVLYALWTGFFRAPIDEKPSDRELWNRVKHWILDEPWNEALDLIEELVGHASGAATGWTSEIADLIREKYNAAFEKYLVSYRFIGLEITPIDTTRDALAISDALVASGAVPGAQHHLERAVALLADRSTDDHANVIKEAISAVEAVCVAITGEQTLGAALKALDAAGVSIHPSLQQAWSKMYGWTSDGAGIRHGGVKAPDPDQALAKYMLITCSAFVSFLVETGRKAGAFSQK